MLQEQVTARTEVRGSKVRALTGKSRAGILSYQIAEASINAFLVFLSQRRKFMKYIFNIPFLDVLKL